MIRPARRFARGCCAALLLASSAQSLACSKLTTVTTPESPLSVSAKPPALPHPALEPVPQPPPPPRVVLGEDDVLALDEALSFDEAGALSPDHADILAEVAAWLAQHDEVTILTIETKSTGEGNKRKHKKLSAALATQIVDALVAEGIAAERLVAAGLGKSEDEQRHVVLRVTERAGSEQMVTTPQ